ncbi:aminotransferase class I/II-fold pyridoxal phosphate-dependent enzyme [Escherichia coli]
MMPTSNRRYRGAGRGSCWLQKVKPEFAGSDFSAKDLASAGAAVLCCQYGGGLSAAIRPPPYLQHQYAARSGAGITCVALAVIRSDEADARRGKLAALITRFRAGVQDLPFTLADSCSAIQPLIVGDNSWRHNWQKLRQQGCWVTAIRPTVPAGTARLRLTLTAAHEMQDIDRLLEVLHGNG